MVVIYVISWSNDYYDGRADRRYGHMEGYADKMGPMVSI